ncbi:hypothetical protein PpBr36_02155 [Pyricularia pennisetigena]|uniref:hypothetical protein n=1 Tax=Pyricularia pennisetigena TaxID=1578925 RepID=UPI001151836F|nr:hypothetical protein PpBr36_02155 [Pyricularia pennisetigena]TLS29326.1 hypothetical protein PpBr36_02155 [Pyricularia pennisetigena]
MSTSSVGRPFTLSTDLTVSISAADGMYAYAAQRIEVIVLDFPLTLLARIRPEIVVSDAKKLHVLEQRDLCHRVRHGQVVYQTLVRSGSQIVRRCVGAFLLVALRLFPRKPNAPFREPSLDKVEHNVRPQRISAHLAQRHVGARAVAHLRVPPAQEVDLRVRTDAQHRFHVTVQDQRLEKLQAVEAVAVDLVKLEAIVALVGA